MSFSLRPHNAVVKKNDTIYCSGIGNFFQMDTIKKAMESKNTLHRFITTKRTTDFRRYGLFLEQSCYLAGICFNINSAEGRI